MKKLTVNCGSAIVTKYDPQMFDAYDEIQINAGTAVFSGEAYEKLSQKKLVVNAASQKIMKDARDLIYLGEEAHIKQNMSYSGSYLLAENLVIDPAAASGLENVAGIMAEKIYYPQSLPLSVVRKMDAEELVAYPDEALLIREDITLDAGFLQSLGNKKTVYVEGTVEALQAEALMAAGNADIRIICTGVYLYTGEKEAYSHLFETRKTVIIPDGYQMIRSPKKPLKHLFAIHGDQLYILGDLLIRAGEKDVLEAMRGLTVEGTVSIPMELLPDFRKTGSAKEIFLYQGVYCEITGKGTLTHEQLNAAQESGTGFTVMVNGVLEIAEDVTMEDLEAVYALHYSGIVQCPGRLQPFLRQKVETGNGLMTEKELEKIDPREEGDVISLGQWVID